MLKNEEHNILPRAGTYEGGQAEKTIESLQVPEAPQASVVPSKYPRPTKEEKRDEAIKRIDF